jgi:ADP-heptose:LPS heptosyltransferase
VEAFKFRTVNLNILILRAGLLGDTLAALPALWALRSAYPQAHIRYVQEILPQPGYVKAEQVLSGSGLVDSFDSFYNGRSVLRRPLSRAGLLLRLRLKRWDLGISLAEPFWSARKKNFARWCGARQVLGPEGIGERHPRDAAGRLLRLPQIADRLLQVLKPLGLILPKEGCGWFDLPLSPLDDSRAEAWLKKAGLSKETRPLLALGLWSNMPAKRWPLDRWKNTMLSPLFLAQNSSVVWGRALCTDWDGEPSPAASWTSEPALL